MSASDSSTPEAAAFQAMLAQSNAAATARGDPAMSTEEADRIGKAFEDPKFREMFKQYIDDLSDPANRAEQEAYLSQLEREHAVPEHMQLVRPKVCGHMAGVLQQAQHGRG